VRCLCALKGHPCFSDCATACYARNPAVAQRTSLSDCARDHLRTVRGLTAAQRAARYPLACAEVWGGAATGHTHAAEDGGPGARNGVRLRDVLDDAQPCEDCADDGTQFFSFCLNRPVPADRVQHCLSCGRCFYHRPGFMRRCAYCDGNPLGGVDPEGNDLQGEEAEEENALEMQFAAEGYWGM
jgi:hypothetical protein